METLLDMNYTLTLMTVDEYRQGIENLTMMEQSIQQF